MSTSNITSHLVKQVEILVAINKNIPFKYRQAFAQLIETKIDAIRTKISADQLIDDKSELLEVERFSELKGKTDSAGVASRALYLLLTEKIRDLLAKNGIAKPDVSVHCRSADFEVEKS